MLCIPRPRANMHQPSTQYDQRCRNSLGHVGSTRLRILSAVAYFAVEKVSCLSCTAANAVLTCGRSCASSLCGQWQGAATKDPSLLEKIAKLTFLRDQARIEQAVADVKQLFSAKIYGQLLRTVVYPACCRIFSNTLTITSRRPMKPPSLYLTYAHMPHTRSHASVSTRAG